MKWESLPSFTGNEVYTLSDQHKKILSLSYHPFSNSARVDCEGEKRVFMIRKEGFRRNKTIVRNEYGVRVCELGTDQGRNFIALEDERYYYSITSGSNPVLQLFRDNNTRPLIQCSLAPDPAAGAPLMQTDKNVLTGANPCLLLALSWYLLLPESKKKTMEMV